MQGSYEMFLAEKRVKAQLWPKDDNNKERKDLQYKRYDAVAKERWVQITVPPLQRQLLCLRGVVEGYRQCFHDYTERFRLGTTDNFGFSRMIFSRKLWIRPRSSVTISNRLWQQILSLWMVFSVA